MRGPQTPGDVLEQDTHGCSSVTRCFPHPAPSESPLIQEQAFITPTAMKTAGCLLHKARARLACVCAALLWLQASWGTVCAAGEEDHFSAEVSEGGLGALSICWCPEERQRGRGREKDGEMESEMKRERWREGFRSSTSAEHHSRCKHCSASVLVHVLISGSRRLGFYPQGARTVDRTPPVPSHTSQVFVGF